MTRPKALRLSCFNTQPPEGGWYLPTKCSLSVHVSTLSRPKAAAAAVGCLPRVLQVSTLSRPKAAARSLKFWRMSISVSTLSRPKAAVVHYSVIFSAYFCFNTQPPEGGCDRKHIFNPMTGVSTLSRPKAAARHRRTVRRYTAVSTLSRPKAADRHDCAVGYGFAVSTLSRPKAAAILPNRR